MGILDFFGKESAKTEKKGLGIGNSNESPLAVYYPKSFKEVEGIIDKLREGKTVIVHLAELSRETSTRIIDMLSGAIYALGGGVYETEKNSNAYMFSPTGLVINK